MKKIINRKLYDTETAQEIAFRSNGGSWSDFSHLEETLYRKKTGEFFLHGEGGPMTCYCEHTGPNYVSGGEQIIPMTYDEAADWAERHMDADAYQAVFGEITEDGDADQPFNCRLPASTIEQLRRGSSKRGTSIKQTLIDLVSTLEV